MVYVVKYRIRGGDGKERENESCGKGGIHLRSSELQECFSLCEKLKQEFENASYIPEEKLSGAFAEALKEVRNYQKSKLEEISKEAFMLKER